MTNQLVAKGEAPQGWVWARLGDIVEFEYGKGLRKDRRDIGGRVPVYGSNGILGYHSDSLVRYPCVVIGRKGAIGQVHLSKTPCWPIDTTYYVCPPDCISLAFSYLLLCYLRLGSLDRSTAIPGLNRDDAYRLAILVPPLAEQDRIVARIEELFTRLEAGVEALTKVKAQLKRYRQAVLKHAFEGKLTVEWRESRRHEPEPASVLLERIKEERRKTAGGKYKELPPLDISELPQLPEGWVWTRLGVIAEINPKLTIENLMEDEEVTFLPMRCVEELTGQVDASLTRRLSEVRRGYTAFASGDLLFAKITPCMENGKVTIAPDLKNGMGFGSTEFHVIRLPEPFPRKLLFYFLVREDLRKDAKRNMTGTAGQLRVPVRYMQGLAKPLPPLPEQHRIVEEIERRFSVADQIEKAVEHGLKKSERLRQSILKRAFEGRLVPQDPNDEPAEILLERIKEERAKQLTEKRVTVSRVKRKRGTEGK